MDRGGKEELLDARLTRLLTSLVSPECDVSLQELQELVSNKQHVIPLLEEILDRAQAREIDLVCPPANNAWMAVVHALFLLAHMRSQASFDKILKFLSQDEAVLHYWLHDLLVDDVWEVLYLLGEAQVEKLIGFFVDEKVSAAARVSACTALVQIALRHPGEQPRIFDAFRKVLRAKHPDPEFVGLIICELTDLKAEALRNDLLRALKTQRVWPGLINAADIRAAYRSPVRKRVPYDLGERYACFRELGFFSASSPRKPSRKKSKLHLENSP